MSEIIFLLGAGASMDAGMPSVAELTCELRRRLPTIHDDNGQARPEFAKLCEKIVEWDQTTAANYERLFDWLSLLRRAEMDPFRHGLRTLLPEELAGVACELAFVIKQPILEVLRERHQDTAYEPSYIGRLRDFVPEHGSLKIFTLNYDLCVEDACRAEGVKVTTGFHPKQRMWKPSLFQSQARGVNLYKLHGSLNWCLGPLRHDGYRPLTEVWPPDWSREGEFLLGPAPKLQHDDPFVTLYSEFHEAVRHARHCVVIGCGLHDDHIRDPLRAASQNGLRIVEVGPSDSGYSFHCHESIRIRAREALEGGHIQKALAAVS